MVLLLWIMHSTVFKSTRRFFHITTTYYFPVFIIIFLFYYVINIPRVLNYTYLAQTAGGIEFWRELGFYEFSIPFLEVSLMMMMLLPFFFFIKSRKYLDYNKED